MGDESTVIEDVEAAVAQENRSLVGETLGSRYLLEEVVGQGGFGRVYRATEVGAQRTWAVKELAFSGSTAVQDTLEKEQTILSWLDHAAIVTRKEALFEQDRVFLIMEFIEGANLRDRLREQELSMPQTGVVELALQVCDALIYLHGQKPYPIIFSDLKPSNLMLTDEGLVKLVDFGIARVKSGDSGRSIAMGTRGYAAPEQYGDHPFDHRVDLYALGVVMHQLLSKEHPRDFKGQLPPVEHYATAVDKELAALIARATDPDPDKRFSTAQSLKTKLQALLKKWNTEREQARQVLVKWAGLASRHQRLVTAIHDSVKEVKSNKQARSKPWATTGAPDPRLVTALGVVGVLVLVSMFLADGLDIFDAVVAGLIGLGVFYWKMKT